MENRRNYYRILHVQPDAPVEVIRASFRTLMQQLRRHPDLGGDHWNAALINEAHSVLTDFARRAAYDRKRITRVKSAAVSGEARTAPAGDTAYRRPGDAAQCPFCQTPNTGGVVGKPDARCRECGSPLCMAERLRLEHDDKRAVKRMRRSHAVAFNTTWPQANRCAGTTRDISLNGMQFATPHTVVEGQLLKLDCDLCSAVARVVARRRKRHGLRMVWIVGVEFITLRFATTQGAFVSAKA